MHAWKESLNMAKNPRMRGQQAGSGLALSARLIRYQPERSKPRIPGGITPDHFGTITHILRLILSDIDREIGTELRKSRKRYDYDVSPKELHIRLNESDKPFPLPIFAGWVEADDIRREREAWNHPDPGLHRFGDDVLSEIYAEAFRYANRKGNHFRYRDWDNTKIPEILEKRAGEKATDPKAGNRFQTCLAIVAQGRAVGTLVVGFRKRPPDRLLRIAQNVLRDWARGSAKNDRNDLLNFLDEFDLGGPRLKNSDWVALI
jgi:hypothetical protein